MLFCISILLFQLFFVFFSIIFIDYFSRPLISDFHAAVLIFSLAFFHGCRFSLSCASPSLPTASAATLHYLFRRFSEPISSIFSTLIRADAAISR
jgi:hypothetical protein